MADYSSPKPIDPVWYRRGHFLRIRCVCNRPRVILALDDVVGYYRIPEETALHRVIARLRCARCGERPSFADVVRSPNAP